MKRVHKFIAGTGAVLALVAVTAFAATPGGTFGPGGGPCGGAGFGPAGMMNGGGGPGAYGPMGPRGHGAMWGGGFGFMSEQNLAALKAQLGITGQQEAAWKAFSDKVTEQAGLMQSAREQHWKSADTETTPQARMALHIGLMTQHLAGMQAVNTAMHDLYAVLTPEQRRSADQALGSMGGRGYGPGRMGWGR
jgi:periplasmic protein CpxP/Spy